MQWLWKENDHSGPKIHLCEINWKKPYTLHIMFSDEWLTPIMCEWWNMRCSHERCQLYIPICGEFYSCSVFRIRQHEFILLIWLWQPHCSPCVSLFGVTSMRNAIFGISLGEMSWPFTFFIQIVKFSNFWPNFILYISAMLILHWLLC